MTHRPETLVLCLGNDLRADDGVGWKVADRLLATPAPNAIVCKSALSGMYLLDELLEFDHVIVVDAVQTRTRIAGEVFLLSTDDMQSSAGPSPHAIGFPSMLRIGRSYGLRLPSRIDVVAIEVADIETLGCGLTAPVASAVPVADGMVRQVLANRCAAVSQWARQSAADPANRLNEPAQRP
jgi:hydrogenase maturation protease